MFSIYFVIFVELNFCPRWDLLLFPLFIATPLWAGRLIFSYRLEKYRNEKIFNIGWKNAEINKYFQIGWKNTEINKNAVIEKLEVHAHIGSQKLFWVYC